MIISANTNTSVHAHCVGALMALDFIRICMKKKIHSRTTCGLDWSPSPSSVCAKYVMVTNSPNQDNDWQRLKYISRLEMLWSRLTVSAMNTGSIGVAVSTPPLYLASLSAPALDQYWRYIEILLLVPTDQPSSQDSLHLKVHGSRLTVS